MNELWELWKTAVRAKDWDSAKKYAAQIDELMQSTKGDI
jgi:hypothetical protein